MTLGMMLLQPLLLLGMLQLVRLVLLGFMMGLAPSTPDSIDAPETEEAKNVDTADRSTGAADGGGCWDLCSFKSYGNGGGPTPIYRVLLL